MKTDESFTITDLEKRLEGLEFEKDELERSMKDVYNFDETNYLYICDLITRLKASIQLLKDLNSSIY